MTYEDQLKKWASNKFGTLDVNHISKVVVYPDTYYGGYCETCSYEEAVWRVKVYGNNNEIIIDETYKEYEYSFASLLKEIVEA